MLPIFVRRTVMPGLRDTCLPLRFVLVSRLTLRICGSRRLAAGTGSMLNSLQSTTGSSDDDLNRLPFFQGANPATLARAAAAAHWYSVETNQIIFDPTFLPSTKIMCMINYLIGRF